MPPTSRLRIGIDAKWLDSGPVSGGVVLRELIVALSALDTQHEFLLFRKQRSLGTGPSHRFREIGTPSRLPNLLSNVTYVPMTADRMRLDAVLYQSYAPPVARHARICVVHDVIDLDHPEYFTSGERAYLRARKFLIPRADLVVTISESEKARLERLGLVTSNSCRVVHWGMGDRFRPKVTLSAAALDSVRARLGLPSRFLLYLGRLNERKNISRLIQAALASNQISPDVPLVLAGEPDGRWNPEIANGPDDMGKLRWLGRVSDDDAPVLMALATAFAYVSLDEGFGLPPLEAMAAGVPVIAASAGSLPEVCGDAAILVDGENVNDIALAIDRVLESAIERELLSEAGIARAAQFTWASTAAKTVAAIEDAVDVHRSSK